MVKNIVIVGGGSAGWMTAAHMSNNLSDVNITLIESPNVPIIGVGESTVPPIVDFMKGLGLQEQEWMPSCNATYKSSIAFSNFHDNDGRNMWFPFSGVWSVANLPANNHWLYKYFTDDTFNDRFSIYDYCTLSPEICRQGKTIRSLPEAAYAYHLDAVALGQFLKDYSTKRGVNHISDTIHTITQKEDGSIDTLELENGPPLSADLFIDCTGFRSMLLEQTLEEPFEDYSQSLFNNKAIAMQLPFDDKEKEMISYTQCSAQSSGWIWTIPLYNRMGTGYVYSGNHLSADEAENEHRSFLKQYLGGERVDAGEARHLDIKVGKHNRTWVKNCVAVGLSAGFIEPLESTGLQIVQSQIHLITETLRGRNEYNCVDVSVYNMNISDLLDSIKDFLICHYALTSREDTPYWRDVKYETKLPDSLVRKLEIARHTMPSMGNQHHFDTGSTLAGFGFNDGWFYILTGMGHLPIPLEKHRAAGIGPFDKQLANSANEAETMYRNMSGEVVKIAQLPSHYQFLKQNLYGGKD